MLNILPKHLILNKIEPYSRRIQNVELCLDIRHISYSLKLIYKIKCLSILKKYDLYNLNDDIHEIMELYLLVSRVCWLFLEIELYEFIFMNKLINKLLKRGLKLNLRKILIDTNEFLEMNGIFDMYKTREKINESYKESKCRVRRIWSIMSIDERKEFSSNKLFN